jgi:hypothetical protein
MPADGVTKDMSFRVRRQYYDQIVAGTKTFELRPATFHWDKRFGDGKHEDYIGGTASFLCGKDVHRREMEAIEEVNTEKRLGRPLSEQGRKDIPTDTAWCVELGEEVEALPPQEKEVRPRMPEKGTEIGMNLTVMKLQEIETVKVGEVDKKHKLHLKDEIHGYTVVVTRSQPYDGLFAGTDVTLTIVSPQTTLPTEE